MTPGVRAHAGSQETESLVRRLAGPSTGKAGLAKDQTEINRIIAEASKGSKFYENEKKRDKDLTERIAQLLENRDELLQGIDNRQVEMSVDRLLSDLESRRDLSQTIVHVDMDAFFANVELLHNPELEGKPFAVGHGVLTTASYEARKSGVRSGMPGFIAKKLCPDLILVPNHFSSYQDMSKKVMSVFKRYDPNMCVAGCDEAYLNITGYCRSHNLTAEQCVQEMRKIVHEETKLTASAGIAANKMLAKICSDKNKPNGQFELPSDSRSIITFMHDLSIRKVPGIGRVSERLLESIGIKTCGDILVRRATISLMDKCFNLEHLLNTHLGIASNVVQPHQREERKSIGAERTFSPLGDKNKILEKLDDVAAELEKYMDENGWAGRTITLKYKLDTYQVCSRARRFDRLITSKEDLFNTGRELLLPELPLKLRLIGLRVTRLKDLRASSLTNGIKRFFEPTIGGSPSKRCKLEHGEAVRSRPIDIENGSVEDHEGEDDGFYEVTLGLHEHEDEMDELMDGACGDSGHDILHPVQGPIYPVPRPPVSAPARITRAVATPERASVSSDFFSKPRSASHAVNAAPLPKPINKKMESLECPICSKVLKTNNQGLNSHIDFCLSRGVIRQAHAEASSPAKGGGSAGWAWFQLDRDASKNSVAKTSAEQKGKKRTL